MLSTKRVARHVVAFDIAWKISIPEALKVANREFSVCEDCILPGNQLKFFLNSLHKEFYGLASNESTEVTLYDNGIASLAITFEILEDMEFRQLANISKNCSGNRLLADAAREELIRILPLFSECLQEPCVREKFEDYTIFCLPYEEFPRISSEIPQLELGMLLTHEPYKLSTYLQEELIGAPFQLSPADSTYDTWTTAVVLFDPKHAPLNRLSTLIEVLEYINAQVLQIDIVAIELDVLIARAEEMIEKGKIDNKTLAELSWLALHQLSIILEAGGDLALFDNDLIWSYYRRLAERFDIKDRMERLNAQRIMLEKLCDSADEKRQHQRSYRIEVLIVLIIAPDLLFLIIDHWEFFKSVFRLLTLQF